MMGKCGPILAAGLLLAAAGGATADHYDDLIRAEDRYRRETADASQDYGRDAERAWERYVREVQNARREYERDMARERRSWRPDWGDIRNAHRDYVRDTHRAGQRYNQRIQRAYEEYLRKTRRAQDRYSRAQGEYYDDMYDWEHRGRRRQGGIWDRIVGRRRHHDDWRRRGWNDYPTYGYDYSDYYWDTGYYGNSYTSNWRPWSGVDSRYPTYDDRRTIHWADDRGGYGYARPHEDSYYGNANWSLSVGVGSYFPGYVSYDPYTYGYNPRNSYHYYQSYHRQPYHLRYDNRPSLQLAASNNYYGDSFFYGNLHIPLD